MFCPRCGFDNTEESTDCSKCGAALGQQALSPAPPVQAPLPPQPETAGSSAGMFIFAGFVIVASLLAGVLYHLVGRVADLFIILAALAGLALGAAISAGVIVARCRNLALVAAVAVLAAGLTYSTRLVLDSRYFFNNEFPQILAKEFEKPVPQARQVTQNLAHQLGPIGTTHFYLDALAEVGVSIGRRPSSRAAIEIKGGLFWLLLAAEIGLIAAVATRAAVKTATAPYCEQCQDWRTSGVMMRFMPGYEAELLTKVMNQEWEEMAALPQVGTSHRKNCCELVLAPCPKCGDNMVIFRSVEAGRERRIWSAIITVDSAQKLLNARHMDAAASGVK